MFEEENLLDQNRLATEERELLFDNEGNEENLSRVAPFGAITTGGPQSTSKYQQKTSLTGSIHDLQALDQPGSHMLANTLIGGAIGGAATVMEGFGYLGDIANNTKRLLLAEEAQDNAMSEYFRKQKDAIHEQMPIYRKDPSKMIDFSDRAFFYESARSVLESAIGFGVPGMAIGKGLSMGLQALNVASKPANLTRLLGTARATNFIEGKTMALESYRNTVSEKENSLKSEIMDRVIENNPNISRNELSVITDQILSSEVYEDKMNAFKEVAAKESDDFIAKNRIFMLTDMVALSKMFKGKQLVDDILKKRNFSNLAKQIGKQAPVEYFEEVGQNVFQKQEEYDIMKNSGADVSDESSSWLRRSLEYAVSEQAQLEGMMGLFGGPMQFMVVQSPDYFSGKKAHNLAYDRQQEQMNLNKQVLASKLNNYSVNQFNYAKATIESQPELAAFIQNNSFDGLAFDNFERGTYQSLKDQLSEIQSGESTIEEIDTDSKQVARQALSRLEELRKDYTRIRNRESSVDESKVRRAMFNTLQSKKALEKRQDELTGKLSSIQNKDGYSDLTDVRYKIKGYKNNLTKTQKQLDDVNNQLKDFDLLQTTVKVTQDSLSSTVSAALVVEAVRNNQRVSEENAVDTIKELNNLLDEATEEAAQAKTVTKKSSIDKRYQSITKAIDDVATYIQLDEEQRQALPEPVSLSKYAIRGKSLNDQKNAYEATLVASNKEIDKLNIEADKLKADGETEDDVFDIIDDMHNELADVSAALQSTKDRWSALNNKKKRADEIKAMEEANEFIDTEEAASKNASATSDEKQSAMDEIVDKYKGKVFGVDVAGTKRKVFINPENPKMLIDVENVTGNARRTYSINMLMPQLTDENIDTKSISEAEINAYLQQTNHPESDSDNSPDNLNVDTSHVVSPKGYAKPDILGVGFVKTAGWHYDRGELDNAADVIGNVKKLYDIDITELQALEIIDASRRFFAASEVLNIESGKYSFVAVTSKNNRYQEDDLIFMQKSDSAIEADIKLVLVNAETKEPIRINGKLVYSNMTTAGLISDTGNRRFTLLVDKVDQWKDGMSQQEMLDAIPTDSMRLDVTDEMDRITELRRLVIDSTEDIYLPVTSKSKGVAKKDQTIKSIVGVIVPEDEILEDVQIEVAMTDKVMTATGEITVTKGSISIWRNGIIYDLKARLLNNDNIKNLLFMLQSYSQARMTGDKNARYVNDKNGSKTEYNIFDTINNMIFFGSKGSNNNSKYYIGYQDGKLMFGLSDSITEQQLIDAIIVINEDGSINKLESSDYMLPLFDFLEFKIHHINRKSLGEQVEMINVTKDDEGNIYLEDTNISNYNEYLLTGASPVLGTENNGVNNSAMLDENGALQSQIDETAFNAIKSNPNKSSVYLMYSTPFIKKVARTTPKAASEQSSDVLQRDFEVALDAGGTGTVKFTAKQNNIDYFVSIKVEGGFVILLDHNLGEKFTIGDAINPGHFIEQLTKQSVEGSVKLSIDEIAEVITTAEKSDADQTNVEKINDIIETDETVDDAEEPIYMLEDVVDLKDYKLIDIEKELAWFQKRFPSIDVSILKNLIDKKAYAKLTESGKVLLYELATEGTLYHEAWHVVSLMMYDDAERKSMYDEYRKRYGTKDMTDSQVDEKLAEMFRAYALRDGNYNFKSTETRNFFQRIYDFLVGLFTNDKIKAEFERIYNNNINKTIRNKPDVESYLKFNKAKVDNLAVKSINRAFFANLFSGGVVFEDIFNLNARAFNEKYSSQIKGLYDKILRQINGEYDITFKAAKNEDDVAGLKVYNQYIKDNWSDLVQQHLLYLEGMNMDVAYDELDDSEYVDNAKESAPYKEASAFSAKDKASPVLRMMFESVPAMETYREDDQLKSRLKKNDIGLVSSIDVNPAFNYLHNTLAGIQSYEEQIAKIKSVFNIRPEFKYLLARLYSNNEVTAIGLSKNQVALQTMFFQQFAKTRNIFFSTVVRPDGTIYNVDNSKERYDRQIKGKWDARFKTLNRDKHSPVTVINGEIVADTKKTFRLPESGKEISISTFASTSLTLREKIHAINKLGVWFSNQNELVFSLSETDKRKMSDDINAIMTGIAKQETITSLFTDDSLDTSVKVALDHLVEYDKAFNSDIKELQHLGPGGKPIYDISLNTFVTFVIDELNTGRIPAHLSKKNKSYQENSEWLKQAKKGLKTNVAVLESLDEEISSLAGVKTSKLSNGDRLVISLSAIFNGISPLLRSADRGTEYGIQPAKFGGTKPMSRKAFIEQMRRYLEDEVNTVIYTLQNKSKFKTKNFNAQKNQLRFFDDILGRYSFDGVTSYEQFVTKYGEEKINDQLDKYAQRLIKQTANSFTDNMISIAEKDQYRVIGISPDHIAKITGSKSATINKLNHDLVAATYAYSFIIGNIEQSKVIFGDLAYYSTEDFFKRTTGAASTKNSSRVDDAMNTWMNANMQRMDGKLQDGTLTTFTVDDMKTKASITAEFKKTIGELANMYLDINEADGQGLVSLDAYREMLYRQHKWTDDQEVRYQWIKANREGTAVGSIPFAVFPVLKPQGFGPQVNADAYIPVFYKLSLLPIYEEMFEDGERLKELAKQMHDTQTDMVLFESAVKVGQIQSNVGLYNEDGSLVDITQGTQQIIEQKYFGIQLDTAPKRKKEAIVGSQMRTLMASNIFNGGIPADFTGDNWNELNHEQQLEISPEFRNYIDFNETLEDLIDDDMAFLLDELNIAYNDKTDTYSFKGGDKAAIGDIIKREMRSRRMARSDIEAIDYIFDQDDIYVDFMKDTEKIESLLYALVSNNVINQKMSGNYSVNVSSTGFENTKRLDNEANDKLLKFYKRNEKTGKTDPMEVMIAHFFKEFFKRNANFKIVNNEIVDDNGKTVAIDERLLDVIGFRIPTSGINSIDFMRIKKFLPYAMADSIVAPSEIVVKTGLDYDIDKMVMYFANYFFDKENMARYIDNEDQYAGYIEGFTDYIKKTLSRSFDPKMISSLVNKLSKSLNDGADAVTASDELKSFIKEKLDNLDMTRLSHQAMAIELSDLLEVINDSVSLTHNYSQKIISKRNFGRMMKQNKLLVLMKERLSSESSFKEFMTPITTNTLEAVANNINKIKDISTEEKSWSEMMSPANLLDVADKFWTGVGGIGILALNTTSHAKFQRAGYYVKEDGFVLDLEGANIITIEDKIFTSLADVYDGSGDGQTRTISSILNEAQNAIIDIAKNTFPSEINMNMDTLGVYSFLIRTGVPVETVAAFMSQPIIVDYIQTKRRLKSKFLKHVNGHVSGRQIINEVVKKFGASYVDFIKIVENQTQSNWNEASLNKELADANKDNQLQLLIDFLRYTRVYNDSIQTVILAEAHDTRIPKNRFQYKEMLNKQTLDRKLDKNIGRPRTDLEKAYEILGYKNDRVRNGGFMNSYTDVFNTMNSMYSQMFFTEDNAVAKDMIDRFLRTLVMDRFGAGKDAHARRVTHAVLTYILQNTNDGNKKIADIAMKMIKGEESVPFQFQRAAEQSENPIFDEMVPVLDSSVADADANIRTSYIKMLSRRFDANTKDEMVEWMKQFKDENPVLYNDLIDLVLVQSGTESSLTSFKDIIPPIDYYNRVVSIAKNISNDMLLGAFEQLFIANNSFNTFFVPVIDAKKTSISVDFNSGLIHAFDVDFIDRSEYNRFVDDDLNVVGKLIDVGKYGQPDTYQIIQRQGNKHFRKYFLTRTTSEQAVDVAEERHVVVTDVIETEKSEPVVERKLTQKAVSLSLFTNHSGGAVGADTVWDQIGQEFGMTDTKHYYVEGNKTPSGNTAITQIVANEADVKLRKANETLGRRFPTSSKYIDNLLRRNWQQVKNSDAVFAVGNINNAKTKVEGGTGWAVQMAIDNETPVFVFDHNSSKWYTWNNDRFIVTETPTLTKNFAGIGSRKIQESGKQAIRDVYKKTIDILPSMVIEEQVAPTVKQDLDPTIEDNESKLPFCLK